MVGRIRRCSRDGLKYDKHCWKCRCTISDKWSFGKLARVYIMYSRSAIQLISV